MNRRGFLKFLSVGTAIGAVAAVAGPEVLSSLQAPKTIAYRTYLIGQDAIIGEYADYISFSDFALTQSMDEAVSNAGRELAYRFVYATDVVQRRIV